VATKVDSSNGAWYQMHLFIIIIIALPVKKLDIGIAKPVRKVKPEAAYVSAIAFLVKIICIINSTIAVCPEDIIYTKSNRSSLIF